MILNKDTSNKIAEILTSIDAIKIKTNDYFTWSSGWHSPIYCDNRLLLSYSKERKLVINALKELIIEKFSEATAFVGVATAGIAHGALLAAALDKPFAYVRSSNKAHGLQNKIEGRINKDAKIVVVEDLISTGKSTIKVIETLQNENYKVIGAVAIFNYGFDFAKDNFERIGVPFYTLSNYTTIIENLDLSVELKKELENWRINPSNWKQ